MPHCAVIWCNNQSKNVNKHNSGVSYHKFPNNPYMKAKWMLATGKYNWFPQKHDTICSEHFEDSLSFKKGSSRLYLTSDAIPTLKLHPIIKEANSHSSTNTIEIHDTAAPAKLRKMSGEDSHVKPAREAIQDGISNTQQETTSNIQDTPRRRKFKMSMLRAQETIKRQTLLVKRLRANNRRLSKKNAEMENIIKNLQAQSAITDGNNITKSY